MKAILHDVDEYHWWTTVRLVLGRPPQRVRRYEVYYYLDHVTEDGVAVYSSALDGEHDE